MSKLGTLSDDELAVRIQRLRREQLRRAGKSHTCARCGVTFIARAGALYCSGACRVAKFRATATSNTSTEGRPL